MCYALVLSTTSDEDLQVHNTDLVRFGLDLPDIPELQNLRYPNCWFIGSRSGCSCTFRHLHSPELGFGEPVDWYPEQADEIEATLQAAKIIRKLVAEGHEVDCIDAWTGGGQVPSAV